MLMRVFFPTAKLLCISRHNLLISIEKQDFFVKRKTKMKSDVSVAVGLSVNGDLFR